MTLTPRQRKLSIAQRAQRIALLPPHERTKPIYASNLRHSTPLSPLLPPLISPTPLCPCQFSFSLHHLKFRTASSRTTNMEGQCKSGNSTSNSDDEATDPALPSSPPSPRNIEKARRERKKLVRTFRVVGPSPPSPRPIRWRCHVCGKSYNLGVTRRCLNDGHFSCTPAAASVKSVPEQKTKKKRRKAVDAKEREGMEGEDIETLNEGKSEKEKEVISLRRRLKEKAELRRKKSKKATKGCTFFFDDAGWRAIGWWRRGGRSGHGMPCDIGCDLPGQCTEWKRKEVLEDKRKIEMRKKARDAEIARLERERQRDETDRLQWEKFLVFESRREDGESAP